MRIVKREEFYKLPAGMLYAEYSPQVFTGLMRKGETIYDNEVPVDYVEISLIDEIECTGDVDMMGQLDIAMDGETNIPMAFGMSRRNGLYTDAPEYYAVWDHDDINGLVKVLATC